MTLKFYLFYLDLVHLFKADYKHISIKVFQLIVKGYLRCKTITSQNVSPEAQVKNFFIL